MMCFSSSEAELIFIYNPLFFTLYIMDTWNEKTVRRQIDEIITDPISSVWASVKCAPTSSNSSIPVKP